MEKINEKKVIVILLFLSLLLFCFSLYARCGIILEKKEIPVGLKIGSPSGFDLDSEILSFGVISFGASSVRKLLIENNYDFPVNAELSVKGDIKDFLYFDEKIFLETGENKEIIIRARVPEDCEDGSYSGIFKIVLKKSRKDI
jgi:hypothetical protein